MDLEPLLYWATEREAIRNRKASGLPEPWTLDPILALYRFCNVRRSDDRVSQWLINNVLKEEYIKADLNSFLMFSALCRWINWPPTIQFIMDLGLWPSQNPDWTAIGLSIDEFHSMGRKAWTGAYMIRAPRKEERGNRGKGQFLAERVIEEEMTKHIHLIRAANCFYDRATIHKVLTGLYGWASFMAGQVVADWGYTYMLRNAPDTYTWAPLGPGSKRGFNRIMERPLATKIDMEEFWGQLQEWRRVIIERLGPEYNDLTLMDAQNCLCETDKYLRVKNGEGRPRATYRPETAF